MEFPSTMKGNLFNLYTNLYCQRQTGDIHLDKMRVQRVHKQSSQRHSVCGSQICAFFYHIFYFIRLYFLLERDRLKS